MLQLGLCLLHANQTMSRHTPVISIGWKSWKESSFSCEYWPTDAFMILSVVPRWLFIWRLIQMHIDVQVAYLLTLSCCSFLQVIVHHLVIVHFRWLQPELGTLCRRLPDMYRRSPFSAANLKLFCLFAHFRQSLYFTNFVLHLFLVCVWFWTMLTAPVTFFQNVIQHYNLDIWIWILSDLEGD